MNCILVKSKALDNTRVEKRMLSYNAYKERLSIDFMREQDYEPEQVYTPFPVSPQPLSGKAYHMLKFPIDWPGQRHMSCGSTVVLVGRSMFQLRQNIRRWKSSPELGRSRRSRGRRRSRCRISVTDPIMVYNSMRETPGWCPFAQKVHSFAEKAHRKVRRNLADAKVRRRFVGARVIETG
jgi:hypothetical protein